MVRKRSPFISPTLDGGSTENLAIWTEGLISQERRINNGPKSDDGWDALEPCQILVDTKSEASEGINEAQAHLDQNVLARYATVAPASILDPSGGFFLAAARPCQRPTSREVKILMRPPDLRCRRRSWKDVNY